MENENILDIIINTKKTLPRKQKQLCDYMLQNYQDIGMFTVKQLAEEAEVGTTTVLRLVKLLGFDSFHDLKRAFHNVRKNYMDKWENVQRSFSSRNEEAASLTNVWQEGINLLNKTLNPQLVESFDQAMDLISNAEQINLLGSRPYRAVAVYLEVLLAEFYSGVNQLSYNSDTLYDRILLMKSNEVFVVFAFRPYVKKVIDAAEVAHHKGVPVVLVTDHLSCPAGASSDVIIKLEPSENHFSIIPVITLVEAMTIELGKRKSDTSIDHISKLVETLKEKGVVY